MLDSVPESVPEPERPTPAAHLIRGRCPLCADLVVSELVYTEGRGYLVWWLCIACDYRRVL